MTLISIFIYFYASLLPSHKSNPYDCLLTQLLYFLIYFIYHMQSDLFTLDSLCPSPKVLRGPPYVLRVTSSDASSPKVGA